MKIGTTDIKKMFLGTTEVKKIFSGTTLIFEAVNEYYNYAKNYYTITNNATLFENAWEHSLTVNPSEISATSTMSNNRGRAQYPNGATEGVIIPEGTNRIGSYAFHGWSSNNQPLVIPDSVTSVGNNVFQNWTSNNQPLVIPNGITSIGGSMFRNWQSNTHPLVIPNGVTSIGAYAFNYWSLVLYVEMKRTTPPTLSNINAFENQNNAPIYVPDESVDDYKTATNWVSLADRIFSINDK